MKLYIYDDPAHKSKGYASYDGSGDPPDIPPGFRPATRPEFILWFLNVARFNLLEMWAIVLIVAIWLLLIR